ncbi:shikimate dehydrogenase family protein [Candidatus Omnitrophota bacterium]
MAEKILGVVGFPLKKSLFPALYLAALKATDIAQDYEYNLFEIEEQSFQQFFESLKAKNIIGLNISASYQAKIASLVEFDEDVSYLKRLKVVDTIVYKDGKWMGYNTQIPALLKELKNAEFDPKRKKCMIIGAESIAKSVAYALIKLDVDEIVVYDAQEEKVTAVAASLKALFPDSRIYPAWEADGLNTQEVELLINTTSLGSKETDPLPVPEKLLHTGMFIYDFIFSPLETKLLHKAILGGMQSRNGFGLLLNQALISFELFTGKTLTMEAFQQALSKAGKPKFGSALGLIIGAVFFILILILLIYVLSGGVKMQIAD